MSWLLWNPAAISYLAESLLALAIAGYFLRRILIGRRKGGVSAPLAWLFAVVAALVPVIVLGLLRAALPPSANAHALPWMGPLWAVSICSLVQFAYSFPRRLPAGRWERRLVALVSAAFVAQETFVAALRQYDLLHEGRVWFRPAAMDIWVVTGVAWALIVLVRQVFDALAQTDEPPPGWPRLVHRLRRLFAPDAGRDAWTGLAYVLFTLLPLAQALAYYLRATGVIDDIVAEITTTWLMLAMLSGFALIFLNALPEHSSFQVKLAGVAMTLVLAVIVAIAWLMGPVCTDSWNGENRIAASDAFRFRPGGQGGYEVTRIAYTFDTTPGTAVDLDTGRIALPFAFPFYGRAYATLWAREDGMAAFDNQPSWSEAQFAHGRIAAVMPMAVELGGVRHEAIAPGSGVFVHASDSRTVVTWRRLTSTMAPSERYTFQMTLYRDGTIDFAYAEVPPVVRHNLFQPHRAPWMTGITPGYPARGVRLVSLVRDLPLHVAPGTAVMQDDDLAFRRHVDRAYAPVAAFMLAAVLLILAGQTLFLRAGLVRPLDRLLHGVEAFRAGDLATRVPVTFHDEIGYLTAAFNDMARAHHDLVETLEQRVARRTAEVAEMTARNARLEERMRLSGDLHDTVSQTLFSAAMLADSLPGQMQQDTEKGEQALVRLGGLSRHALTEMRLLLTELRTTGADERPLGPDLATLARDFETAHTVAVHLDVTGDALLPAEVRATFHRMAQESLNNIAKHAGAKRVDIAFEALPAQALLTVRDDGRGFDPAQVGKTHLGLQIMQERAQKIGAVLDIDTASGRGTAITLVWLPDDDA